MADLEQVASDLNSASQSLQELREKYDGALDLLDNKNTEITAALESAKSNALQEVQTASDTATSQISQLKDTSLNAVNEAKNTATSEISSKKDETLGEFSQATSEFNSIKEEALSQIEQAKTEQGEKIIALEQAKTEQESSITELKESVSTQGQKITEIEENNTAQGEKITALEQAKESITADLNKKAKLLTEDLTWTVGSGGDYEDLQSAFNEIIKYSLNSKNKITINLINYTAEEDLTNINGDFSNIYINGNNNLIDCSFFAKFENIKLNLFNIKAKTLQTSININKSDIFFNNIDFESGEDCVNSISSKITINGSGKLNSTQFCINSLASIISINASLIYNSTNNNFNLTAGSIIYSFNDATSNIAKNTPTKNGIFFN
ncbi:TPA: hypothetical protein R5A97_000235 [Campylobacter jejuni]|nr:hypothetical protein [Campylobacter jejuni]